MSTVELERRLVALERQVADLKSATGAKRHPAEALERIHGMFENDDAFAEAMRAGREWRESQRPAKGKARGK
jgi:hypothetical protein